MAGYPDPHPDSATEDEDVAFLKAKVEAGADYIITQLFYDVDIFLRWKQRCRAAGVSVPIIPGVMPIQNYASFRRMTALCKASVPHSILTALEPIKVRSPFHLTKPAFSATDPIHSSFILLDR